MAQEPQALQGSVALVTGGSRGIGAAISQLLAADGALVIVNYASRKDAADEVVRSIESSGGRAVALGFDVSSEQEVEGAIKKVIEEHRSIDILVNNAGIALDSLILRAKSEDWQRTLDVNLSSCFYASRAVLKPMLKKRAGRIINMSSVIGEMGNAGQAAYAASKAGIIGLTKSLAKEVASRGITVNAVTPGYIQTDMTSALSVDQSARIAEQIPLGRLGTAEDVANAVLFFAKPSSSYITGAVLGVNGGLYM